MMTKKFRIYDQEEKRMIEWDELVKEKKINEIFTLKNNDKYTDIMQCTEIKDINKKDVYEKDIVKVIPRKGYGYITSESEIGYVDYSYGSYIIRGMGDKSYLFIYAEVEVIGDVHNNIDLLNY
jgi:uncharacterized phage protein (TIGR01671 family)